jgi:hypothetical protein
MKRLVAAIVCSLIWCSPASGQTCRGQATFENVPLRVGGDVAFSGDMVTFGGGVRKSFDRFFAGGGALFHSISDFDSGATSVGGYGGTEMTVDSAQKFHLCPTAGILLTFGPSPGADIDASSFTFSAGASLGFVASTSGTTSIVPTFGFTFNVRRVKLSGGFFDDEFSETEPFGALHVGVGFVFNDRLSLVPALLVPFGADGADPTVLVAFSTKIGG